MATFMNRYRSWRTLDGRRPKGSVRPLRYRAIADPDCLKKLHDDQSSKHINHYPTRSILRTTAARINPKSNMGGISLELPCQTRTPGPRSRQPRPSWRQQLCRGLPRTYPPGSGPGASGPKNAGIEPSFSMRHPTAGRPAAIDEYEAAHGGRDCKGGASHGLEARANPTACDKEPGGSLRLPEPSKLAPGNRSRRKYVRLGKSSELCKP